MTVWCAGASSLGAVIGYLLNWTVRHDRKPDARELTLLIGAAAGGTAIVRVRELMACEDALAWYLIGLAAGFFLYSVAVWSRWDALKRLIATRALHALPLFPWRYR